MTLVINQIVRVRIAFTHTTTQNLCVGQIYETDTSTWLDVVWIVFDLNFPNLSKDYTKFGNIEYYCIVNNLTLNRNGTTRPSVCPLAYIDGGIYPDAYITTATDTSMCIGIIDLYNNGTQIKTTLPALGDITNNLEMFGSGPINQGGSLVRPLPYLGFTSGVTYTSVTLWLSQSTFNGDVITGIEHSSNSIAAFNTWLTSNRLGVQNSLCITWSICTIRNSVPVIMLCTTLKYAQSNVLSNEVVWIPRSSYSMYQGVRSNATPIVTNGCPNGTTFTGVQTGLYTTFGIITVVTPTKYTTAGGTNTTTLRFDTNSIGIDFIENYDSTGRLTSIDVQPYYGSDTFVELNVHEIEAVTHLPDPNS